MGAGVFAVAAANQSLLYSFDSIKDKTPAALSIHRLQPLLPSKLRVQAERSCRPAIHSTMQLEKYFLGGTASHSRCALAKSFCQASFYLYNEYTDFLRKYNISL